MTNLPTPIVNIELNITSMISTIPVVQAVPIIGLTEQAITLNINQ